jgi:hypothetical protein
MVYLGPSATSTYSVAIKSAPDNEGGYIFMSVLPSENEIKMITHKSKRIKGPQNPITSQA